MKKFLVKYAINQLPNLLTNNRTFERLTVDIPTLNVKNISLSLQFCFCLVIFEFWKNVQIQKTFVLQFHASGNIYVVHTQILVFYIIFIRGIVTSDGLIVAAIRL